MSSGLPLKADIAQHTRYVRFVPKGDMIGSLIAQSIRSAKGAGHLLRPCRVVRLEGCQHVAGLFCDADHLSRAASRFIPFSKSGITADEDFQTCPPIRPHLQGARRRFETRLRASGEKTRERENVEPDEVLRVVWAQSQPIVVRWLPMRVR